MAPQCRCIFKELAPGSTPYGVFTKMNVAVERMVVIDKSNLGDADILIGSNFIFLGSFHQLDPNLLQWIGQMFT